MELLAMDGGFDGRSGVDGLGCRRRLVDFSNAAIMDDRTNDLQPCAPDCLRLGRCANTTSAWKGSPARRPETATLLPGVVSASRARRSAGSMIGCLSIFSRMSPGCSPACAAGPPG